jgi:hypothetical protein
MTPLVLTAQIGRTALDILVLLSLVTSLLLLGWRTANLYTRRRHHARWLAWIAVLAWVVAAFCLVSLAVTGWRLPVGEYVARMRPIVAAGALLLSLVIMLLASYVDNAGDRRRAHRRLAVSRWR